MVLGLAAANKRKEGMADAPASSIRFFTCVLRFIINALTIHGFNRLNYIRDFASFRRPYWRRLRFAEWATIRYMAARRCQKTDCIFLPVRITHPFCSM